WFGHLLERSLQRLKLIPSGCLTLDQRGISWAPYGERTRREAEAQLRPRGWRAAAFGMHDRRGARPYGVGPCRSARPHCPPPTASLHLPRVLGAGRACGTRFSSPRDPEGQIGRAHSELQSRFDLVCRLLLEKKKLANKINTIRLARSR